jgi:hypothetical protein
MARCGYLLMWEESGDEIHVDLISLMDYKRYKDQMKNPNIFKTGYERTHTPIISWFSQTFCSEPWPFKDCEILGTLHLIFP